MSPRYSDDNPAYDDKALLRLFEHYTIRALGAMPAEKDRALQALAPKLGKTFQASGTWYEIVASAGEFPLDIDEQIRQLWAENLEIAKQRGETLTPQEFAEMFVLSNFDFDAREPAGRRDDR